MWETEKHVVFVMFGSPARILVSRIQIKTECVWDVSIELNRIPSGGLHRFDEILDMQRINVRVDPVAEVGDVATPAELVHHLLAQFPYGALVGVQGGRVQVALQGRVTSDQPTGFSRVHRPIDTQHLITCTQHSSLQTDTPNALR